MTGLVVGQLVTDTAGALPAGTVITGLGQGTITLSQAATKSQTGDGFTSSIYAHLGPLQNNGGPLAGAPGSQQVVATMALLPGSPALDAGDSSVAVAVNPDNALAVIADPGFETPSLRSGDPFAPFYKFTRSGSPWTFSPPETGGAGLASNGSAFNNPPAPQGSQVAFLQQSGFI